MLRWLTFLYTFLSYGKERKRKKSSREESRVDVVDLENAREHVLASPSIVDVDYSAVAVFKRVRYSRQEFNEESLV